MKNIENPLSAALLLSQRLLCSLHLLEIASMINLNSWVDVSAVCRSTGQQTHFKRTERGPTVNLTQLKKRPPSLSPSLYIHFPSQGARTMFFWLPQQPVGPKAEVTDNKETACQHFSGKHDLQ